MFLWKNFLSKYFSFYKRKKTEKEQKERLFSFELFSTQKWKQFSTFYFNFSRFSSLLISIDLIFLLTCITSHETHTRLEKHCINEMNIKNGLYVSVFFITHVVSGVWAVFKELNIFNPNFIRDICNDFAQIMRKFMIS